MAHESPPIAYAAAAMDEVAATGLLRELDADLAARYPGETIQGVDPLRFSASGGYCILARRATNVVGCGAFRRLDAETVEIKRMFVRAPFRGRGVAKRILELLETEARARGFRRVVLESGDAQPEANALYRRAGYRPIAPFAPGVGVNHGICFGKRL